MGKRSSFERAPRDYYPTPAAAVAPLLAHLPERCRFVEPCGGDGALLRHLSAAGHHCVAVSDIDPQAEGIESMDVLAEIGFLAAGDFIITNPPWRRDILHPMIAHFAAIRPTWLLFDSDWVHTRQSAPYMPLLRAIVSVGRVKWFADSPHTGKSNCAWHLFDAASDAPAVFHGRTA